MKTAIDEDKHNSIEYWIECYNRVHEKDIFSKCMILGKIKQLQRQQNETS